ncbi:uncharacterized protein G2W53_028877 [Senna tora]|uniref:Uncharacterized protein n=1 Tax=Senna tora TaxID=362788 RepID=A0A834WB71_9FABA|nr:uncharacterized protein G2W53_028877 [Senna tora]
MGFIIARKRVKTIASLCGLGMSNGAQDRMEGVSSHV